MDLRSKQAAMAQFGAQIAPQGTLGFSASLALSAPIKLSTQTLTANHAKACLSRLNSKALPNTLT